MEYVGDNYLENINVMVSWDLSPLLQPFILFHKIFSLRTYFCHFTIMRPIPQFIMNRRLQDSGDSWSKLRNEITWACLG